MYAAQMGAWYDPPEIPEPLSPEARARVAAEMAAHDASCSATRRVEAAMREWEQAHPAPPDADPKGWYSGMPEDHPWLATVRARNAWEDLWYAEERRQKSLEPALQEVQH